MQDDAYESDLKSGHVIEDRIIHAALSGRISPGERLGEKELCEIFGVSRTLVREAMMRLQARRIVAVSPRRGWYIVEPGLEEAQQTIEARRAVETGMLLTHTHVTDIMVARLRAHIASQQVAIDSDDRARRSFLLGHFHVCLAETLGNPVLAAILEDLTTRTVLIAAMYQSIQDAQQSCNNHVALTDALERGDTQMAVHVLDRHLTQLVKALSARRGPDRMARLREALVG